MRERRRGGEEENKIAGGERWKEGKVKKIIKKV